MSDKPIEIKDELETKPAPEEIRQAERLARETSPLLGQLFNAKAEKEENKDENP